MQELNEDVRNSLLERKKFLKATGLGSLSIAGASLFGGAVSLAVPATAQVPGPGKPVTLSANDAAILTRRLQW
jgi:hypothetical protein